MSEILDSGERRQFNTGAVRDIAEGKGRADLLPIDILKCPQHNSFYDTYKWYDGILENINSFMENGGVSYLFSAIQAFCELRGWTYCTMLLEVSKQYEDGAKKYGDNNWRKGIPVKCYLDSTIRHYLKYCRGDKDEPHDRAICWNLLCAIWTCKHKPELNDYIPTEDKPEPKQ